MTVTINGTTGITSDGGYAGDGVSFADGTPSNTLVTTAGGNVGIGTSSPSSLLNLSSTTTAQLRFNATSGTSQQFDIGTGGGLTSHFMYGYGAYPMVFGTNNAERMRIDSSGRLLVGRTSNTDSATLQLSNESGGSNIAMLSVAGTTGDSYPCMFRNPNGQVGAIKTNGSSTAYNTSSDYRLKENIQPMQNALAVVQQLSPVTYTWKTDGSNGQGFIAHELQAVVPDCVTGEKDAVETYLDEEGNEQTRPKYQGIDTSFLVATLTAAIQEQQALITQLQADVAALKGQAQ